jgi:hypothetical protein
VSRAALAAGVKELGSPAPLRGAAIQALLLHGLFLLHGGVDVAVGRMEAQGQGIIGTAIPIAEHAVAQ